ncbi:MAG: Ni/Fe hydrogenase subunit alpha [Terriglobia bacterium]|jgi:F420-non-reducing hydrogenase large subunit|nr:Ni/Fe hydrogenase subunit alpha [Terriglobia bacterium]
MSHATIEPVGKGEKKTITIDPITRLEGHGKISIFLDDAGEVERAYFQVPELRGFEKFVQGRPAEEMPQITSRICGVCPMAHHMAATKALDAVFHVTPPRAAHLIRELAYSIFYIEDHLLHFFFLGGPDLIVGPDAPSAERNVLGVIKVLGIDAARKVISTRQQLRDLNVEIAGKAIHPVFGLPGGVSKALGAETIAKAKELAREAKDFTLSVLDIFENKLFPVYADAIKSDGYTHATYYMGLVDHENRPNFYDGEARIVGPDGREWKRFRGMDYLNVVAEHVEPWSYVKFCYLKPIGWKGFQDGAESGVYSVAPLARLNVAEKMATPLAQAALERYRSTFGARIVHHTLANHWARLIETIYASERMAEIAADPEIADRHVRTIPTEKPTEGVGIVEAPRGTLIHHYKTDERGIITNANLIVATQHNAARIAMSVDRAAKDLIHRGIVTDGILNRVEMAFRAYDPCNGCATHAIGQAMPIFIEVRGKHGNLIETLERDVNGTVRRTIF